MWTDTSWSAKIVQVRQGVVQVELCRGKSCKFVPQKVGLNYMLMDEDVLQIYKNKTKTQIKKEKIGTETN